MISIFMGYTWPATHTSQATYSSDWDMTLYHRVVAERKFTGCVAAKDEGSNHISNILSSHVVQVDGASTMTPQYYFVLIGILCHTMPVTS